MKQSKITRFLNGKGFYIALGICMLAVGVSGWTAIGKSANTDNISQSQTAENSSEVGYFVTSDTSSTFEESSLAEGVSSAAESEEQENLSDEETAEAGAPVAKYFTYPVKGEVIKEFSDSQLQYSLTYNDMRLHKGVDIKADKGTAVISAGDGVVTFAGEDSLMGYTVKINHGNGIEGVYCGLAKSITVNKGDEVKSGTTLAPLGDIPGESVDAPHLHFEIYKNGEAIDPLSVITNN